MRTLASAIRLHHWIVGSMALLAAGLGIALFGTESAPPMIGWSIAIAWTIMMGIEASYHIARRWAPEQKVTSAALVISFVCAGIVLMANTGGTIWLFRSIRVWSVFVSWYESFTASYVESMFGGSYAMYALAAGAIVTQWAAAFGIVQASRALFSGSRSSGSTAGWILRSLTIVAGVVCSAPVFSIAGDSVSDISWGPRFSPFSGDPVSVYRVQFPIVVSVTVVGLYINIKQLSLWAGRVDRKRLLQVVVATGVTWSVPALIMLRYALDRVAKYDDAYAFMLALIPTVATMWAYLFRTVDRLRKTPSAA